MHERWRPAREKEIQLLGDQSLRENAFVTDSKKNTLSLAIVTTVKNTQMNLRHLT